MSCPTHRAPDPRSNAGVMMVAAKRAAFPGSLLGSAGSVKAASSRPAHQRVS